MRKFDYFKGRAVKVSEIENCDNGGGGRGVVLRFRGSGGELAQQAKDVTHFQYIAIKTPVTPA